MDIDELKQYIAICKLKGEKSAPVTSKLHNAKIHILEYIEETDEIVVLGRDSAVSYPALKKRVTFDYQDESKDRMAFENPLYVGYLEIYNGHGSF